MDYANVTTVRSAARLGFHPQGPLHQQRSGSRKRVLHRVALGLATAGAHGLASLGGELHGPVASSSATTRQHVLREDHRLWFPYTGERAVTTGIFNAGAMSARWSPPALCR